MEITSREAKNAYMRNYFKNNPKKRKEIQERYWKKKAKELNLKGECK